MNIKLKLRDLEITQTEFAEMLDISRPTLNHYISLYEAGKPLPNSQYERIFKLLFSEELDSKEKFLSLLNRYRYYLFNREKRFETLSYEPKNTDLMESVYNSIKTDLKENDFDEDIYIFINMLIANYRKEKTFKDFISYFLYLNGVKDIDGISDREKNFVSNIFKIMHLYKNEKLQVDEVYYSKFIDRIDEIKDYKEKNKENLKKKIFREKIESKINELIEEQLNLGLDVEDIDINHIMGKTELTNLYNRKK